MDAPRSLALPAVLATGLGLGLFAVIVTRRRAEAAPAERPPYFLYTVQPGDTFSGLALKFFGDAAKWPLLSKGEALTAKAPTLQAGAKLRVPCVWVQVEKGENLAAIAKRILGNAGRFGRIAAANKQALPDPNKIGVGQWLAVPQAEEAQDKAPVVEDPRPPRDDPQG